VGVGTEYKCERMGMIVACDRYEAERAKKIKMEEAT